MDTVAGCSADERVISIGEHLVYIKEIEASLVADVKDDVVHLVHVGVVDVISGGDFGFFHIGNTDGLNDRIREETTGLAHHHAVTLGEILPDISELIGAQHEVDLFTVLRIHGLKDRDISVWRSDALLGKNFADVHSHAGEKISGGDA